MGKVSNNFSSCNVLWLILPMNVGGFEVDVHAGMCASQKETEGCRGLFLMIPKISYSYFANKVLKENKKKKSTFLLLLLFFNGSVHTLVWTVLKKSILEYITEW